MSRGPRGAEAPLLHLIKGSGVRIPSAPLLHPKPRRLQVRRGFSCLVMILSDRLAWLFCDESGANLEHGVGGPEMGSRSDPGFQRSSARFAVGLRRFRTGWRCRRRGRCRMIGRRSSARRGSATVVLDRCGWGVGERFGQASGLRHALRRAGSPAARDRSVSAWFSGVRRFWGGGAAVPGPRGGSRGPALGLRRCAQVRAPNLALCEPKTAGRWSVVRRRSSARQAAARWVSEIVCCISLVSPPR